MPIALGFLVQLAFFGFGTFRLATIFFRWLLHPRETVGRMIEERRADPAGASEREAMQAGVLVPVACAAWLWADLNLIWLLVAVLLGLSALSGFMSARRTREMVARGAPPWAPPRGNLDELAARGRHLGATTSGGILVLWVYSWWRPLQAMWEYVSTG